MHIPLHASWLNQGELSIVHRKVLRPNHFADLDGLEQRVFAFGPYYEQIARPFERKFTGGDLDRCSAGRRGRHETPPTSRRPPYKYDQDHQTSKNFGSAESVAHPNPGYNRTRLLR